MENKFDFEKAGFSPNNEFDPSKIRSMSGDIDFLKDIQQKVMHGVVLIIFVQILATTVALVGVLHDIFKKEETPQQPIVVINK